MQTGKTWIQWFERHGVWMLLVVVIAVSAVLRLYDVEWDSGIMAHPDERSTVAFYAPTIAWPGNLSEALDPHRSPLNPFWDTYGQHRRSYTYGHFPLYLLVLVGSLLRALAPLAQHLPAPAPLVNFLLSADSASGFLVIGRALTALFDIGSVYLVFLIGRRLYGRWAGLLAAVLTAFTVIQIQLAHFFAVDPISTTFVLLTIYGAIRMAEEDSTGAAILTGVAAGLAIASKFSALPIMMAPAVASLAIVLSRKREGRSIHDSLLRLCLCCLTAFLTFVVTSPYVLLDFGAFFIAVVKEQGAMVRGVADMPFTRQYRGTLPYVYFIEQQLRWGMGWLLGIVSFAGLGWVIIRAFTRRIRIGELIVLAWLIPYFGFTGLFLAKFMRYMSSVVPLVIILGAGMLVALWRWGAQKGRRGIVARWAAVLLIVLTLVTTVFWSLAFVNGVYGAEHPWVQASRWIYAHIPDGSALGLEHWDDNLPFGLPEPGANMGTHGYRVVEFPLYEEDTAAKYELLKERVRQSDYIILASNRLYRTIPRLPERYPLSTKYYEALFSGALGFERVKEFTAYPSLGPFVINDDAADESFTVYDHPKPIIFRKVRDLSDTEWEQLFANSWEHALPGYVGQKTVLARLWGESPLPVLVQVSESPANSEGTESKSLLLSQPVDTLPVVDDFRWNEIGNRSPVFAVFFWWFVVQAVGLVGWPLTFVVFRNLADRGHILAKSLTLLLAAYLVWLPSSFRLAQNRLLFILVVLGLIAVLSVVLLWQRRAEVRLFLKSHWKLILLNEVVFVVAYLLFVGIRVLNPDLWQPWLGGEKFMDFAFLNATLKSAYFPPYDPYFAGGYLNYYYYGQYVVGLLFKLAGIAPTVAFNLVIPMLFALTVGNSFCLGYNLTANGKWHNMTALATGFTASAFVAILGNVEGFLQLWRQFGTISGSSFHSTIPGLEGLVRGVLGVVTVLQGRSLPSYDYWGPTRVIPYTINEFPFFSFLFADLHPHMINIPFVLLFVALLLNIVRGMDSHILRPHARQPDLQGDTASPVGGTEQPRAVRDLAGAAAGGCDEVLSQPGPPFVPDATQVRRPADHAGGQLSPRRGKTLWVWVMLPLVLGAMSAINTWDFPTFWGLAVLLVFFMGYWRRGRFNWLGTLLFGIALGGVSLLLYWPFFAHYQAISVGIGLVDLRTDPDKFLAIWALFLFVVGSFLFAMLVSTKTRSGVVRLASLFLRRWSMCPHCAMLYRTFVHSPTAGYRLTVFGVVMILIVAMGLSAFGYGVVALLLFLSVPAALLLTRRQAKTNQQFAVVLALMGLLVLIGCEIFYMKDFLGDGDWKRMNTLFKFYIQVWLLLAIASAAFLPWLMAMLDKWRSPVLRIAWNVAFVALLAATLVYPVLGTGIRVNDRFPGARPPIGTLDGMAFMSVGSYTWPSENNRIELRYDYDAIRWLLANVSGTPVIAEANLPYYREGGLRVSSMTGLPTLLGMHQSEQRYGWQVGERDGLTREFFNTTDLDRTRELLAEMHIAYIYVGKLERTVYDQLGLQKFDEMAENGEVRLVFENPEVKIYRVV